MSLMQIPSAPDQAIYPPTTGDVNFYGSRGLVGVVNAVTPLTKYDLSADAVILKNPVNNTVVRTAVTAITNDLGLAGPAANGRDIVGAFGVSSWVYLYFIWNGATLATVSSLTAPPTGPVLPTGYTHWCFATAVRWNAVSNIIPMRTQGNETWYDLADGGVNNVLGSGVATAMTAIACSGFVPPNVVKGYFLASLSVSETVARFYTASFRPTGAANAGRAYITFLLNEPASGFTDGGSSTFYMPLGTSQQIDYKIIATPAAGGLTVTVLGFVLPNGG